MLELRPSCENCNRLLPPDADCAMICSFECTFCVDCVRALDDICPNCGGGFTSRPIRPAKNWLNNNCLQQYPASTMAVFKPVDWDAQRALQQRLAGRPPELR